MGNTTEPHLHAQLMDHRWPLVAAGMPSAIGDILVEDGHRPRTATQRQAPRLDAAALHVEWAHRARHDGLINCPVH